MQDLEKTYKEIESADIEKLQLIQWQMRSQMIKQLLKSQRALSERRQRIEKQKKLS